MLKVARGVCQLPKTLVLCSGNIRREKNQSRCHGDNYIDSTTYRAFIYLDYLVL